MAQNHQQRKKATQVTLTEPRLKFFNDQDATFHRHLIVEINIRINEKNKVKVINIHRPIAYLQKTKQTPNEIKCNPSQNSPNKNHP